MILLCPWYIPEEPLGLHLRRLLGTLGTWQAGGLGGVTTREQASQESQRPAHQPGWFDGYGRQHLVVYYGDFGVFGFLDKGWRKTHTLQRSGPQQDGLKTFAL